MHWGRDELIGYLYGRTELHIYHAVIRNLLMKSVIQGKSTPFIVIGTLGNKLRRTFSYPNSCTVATDCLEMSAGSRSKEGRGGGGPGGTVRRRVPLSSSTSRTCSEPRTELAELLGSSCIEVQCKGT